MKITQKTTFTAKDTTDEIINKILENRGIKTAQEKQEFLKPPKPSLSLLRKELGIKSQQLTTATSLIKDAIKNNEDICIYGDYDADGVTSTAIMWSTLNHMGARVLPFIPHRKKHGYGISRKALDEILSGQAFQDSPLSPFIPKLIITVDTGIVAHEEIQYLKEKGIKVILTDHHQQDKNIPKADVIIHSIKTAAAGIAWLFSLHLMKENDFSKDLIDLATIGIIADQIPLTGVNRNITKHGLKKLSNPTNLGLKTLYNVANIDKKEITTYDINFAIAPRINAMGRLEHSIDALRLLCTTNQKTAINLAETLEHTNKTRQDMTEKAIAHARGKAENNKITIVASDAYHEGIIGLIAGKLMEETGKPTLAIAIDGEVAKGSARSIKGVNITDLLRSDNKWLKSVGGHKMAAGFSLETKDLDAFIKQIQAKANQEIKDDILIRTKSVEGKLTLKQNTKKLHQNIQKLQPFGMGNPRPKFLSSEISILDHKKLGKTGQHLKMILSQNNTTIEAVWFRFNHGNPEEISQIIYSLDLNIWQGKETLQLIINHAT